MKQKEDEGREKENRRLEMLEKDRYVCMYVCMYLYLYVPHVMVGKKRKMRREKRNSQIETDGKR
jgi:hypothetical protein